MRVARPTPWHTASSLAQMVITASQIQWTADVTKCLMTAKERGDKKILKVMKKKQVGNSREVELGLELALQGRDSWSGTN